MMAKNTLATFSRVSANRANAIATYARVPANLASAIAYGNGRFVAGGSIGKMAYCD